MDEFNPNIAMEYGFTRGLGKSVALLKDQGFKSLRAEFSGLIANEFVFDPRAPDETEETSRVALRRSGYFLETALVLLQGSPPFARIASGRE